MPRQKNKATYFESVGRRKSAICRVRLYLPDGKEMTIAGKMYPKGAIMINDVAAPTYFKGAATAAKHLVPLTLTSSEDRFVVLAYVNGGGKTGQLTAFTLGVARALEKVDKSYRLVLKKAGLLSVDARVRERRKAGMAGKARKKRQSPKR